MPEHGVGVVETKRNGGSEKIKAATDKFIRARKIVCPAAAFFFSAAGQMWLGVKYLFNASVKHKCYTNVRGVFDFDRKTG